MSKMIVFIVFILPFVYGEKCPPADELRPCECSPPFFFWSERGVYIICPGLEDDQALNDVMYALTTTKKIESFTIENSNFRFLPRDIFKGISLYKLKISSSRFMSLTDADFAFEGLEYHLTHLDIRDSTILNTWDWSALRKLKKLAWLTLSGLDLTAVSEEIEVLDASLEDLTLANNRITHIHDKGFSKFKRLGYVTLRNNSIRVVKRSMLPNPATKLWHLDLSYNKIQHLPTDLFENMPRLTTLDLRSNQLFQLNEKPLKDVWTGLTYFDAYLNPLRCDCQMAWMVGTSNAWHNVDIRCDQPMHLRGKSPLQLAKKDLRC